MKTTLILTLILFFLMIFFPLITLINSNSSKTENTQTTYSQTKETEKENPETVEVLSSQTGKVGKMTLEDYLFFTVAAEMPASYHREALKAQTVASYTYLKWIRENADNPPQFTADITSDPSKHQATVTDEELHKKWGSSYDIYAEKIKDAVKDVLYEYVEYKSKAAMTVFHALSSGSTHSSEEVWGSALSYLEKTTAPGDKLSPDFSYKEKISKEKFLSLFKGADSSHTKEIISGALKDSEGFIKKLSFGKESKTDKDIRSALSLKSPYFKIKEEKNNIIFTVYGKGHGAGMSQYSADYMARQGYTYKEILLHFYKGTAIVKEK